MPKKYARGRKRNDGEKSTGSSRRVDSNIYSVGEEVLACRGSRIYKAIVQRVGIERNYFVRYLDQTEYCDEWVEIDRLMKYNEKNIEKQKALDEEQGVNKSHDSDSLTQISLDKIFDALTLEKGVKSSGAKGKNMESYSSMEEDWLGRDFIDNISLMSNEVLLNILSRLPLKFAVATCVLSTRWRTVWCDLKKLDFDATKIDQKPCVLERGNYIDHVHSVIRSHKNPMVEFFRICCDLDKTCFKDIDKWIRFALDKNVELLELDLCEFKARRDTKENYDFPLPLSNGNMVHLSEWPPSGEMGVGILPLKKLFLLRVNVSELTLNEVLKHSPHLEVLYIYGSGLLTDINVGGHDINLKHFILMSCAEVQSISLYNFDLEKFHYVGRDIEIRLRDLPKIKEVDIGRVSVGLNNKVFGSISSLAPYIEVLSLDIDRTKEDLNVMAIPILSNVKTLKLTLPTQQYDSILEFIEIAKACPILETFKISLHWCSPNTRRKAFYAAIGHSFPYLKRLEIGGYCGRNSDFEIALYMIGNAASSLKKIVIDPSCHPYDQGVLTRDESLEREEAGRSHAKSMLSQCTPPWVEFSVL